MKALTVFPEWAYAIRFLGKDVENRTWQPPKNIIGRRIALHSGLKVGGRSAPTARSEQIRFYYDNMMEKARIAGIESERFGNEKIVWRAGDEVLLNGRAYRPGEIISEMIFKTLLRGAIFATAEIETSPICRVSLGDNVISPWVADGKYPWILKNVSFLDRPVMCTGRQAVWALSDNMKTMVLAQQGLIKKTG